MVSQVLHDMLQENVEALGYQLWGVQLVGAAAGRTLRVMIDHADGIALEDCEKVSHQLSQLLDVHDPVSGEYQLEISSPGIDRPLFHLWQYQRYCGEQLRLAVYAPAGQPKKLIGKLVSADDDQLLLEIDGEQQQLPLASVQRANLISDSLRDAK